MMRRLTITFTVRERAALEALSKQELRPMKEQVRHLVRAEAQRLGLWPEDDPTPAGDGARGERAA